ncbi:hypothetical protein [Pseudoxanthomonas sp.]|jgi:hypothetical protein|uniref:hypothetical protein n=1 Tax=Pseudoxanthomonas sp. TaxID=1871049 RepID=UPI00268EF487|nr:hypothetical protein [Pseudoxanthomonas sp.]
MKPRSGGAFSFCVTHGTDTAGSTRRCCGSMVAAAEYMARVRQHRGDATAGLRRILRSGIDRKLHGQQGPDDA